MGDLAGNSFEFYDGVRILVTGAILTAIYVGVVETFALHAPLPTSDALATLGAVTLSGLFMYFIDIPGKCVLYSAMLPHLELDKWELQAPRGRSMQNVYFVLLDTRIPPAMRNRAQYYGSMFRIGFDTIVLFCLSGTVAITAAFLCTYQHGSVHSDGARPVTFVGGGLFLLLGLCALCAAYVRSKPKSTETHKRAMIRELNDQVPWVDRFMLLVVVGFGVGFAFKGTDWMLIVTGAVGSGLWLLRYHRGALLVKRRGRGAPKADSDGEPLPQRWRTASRRNVNAATATLLLCATALSIWIPASVRSASGTHLSSAAALGWTATVLVGGILMLVRGHESKFWGSYYTVLTWLGKERNTIVEEFGLIDPTAPSTLTEPPAPKASWWRSLLGLH